jgi:inorganic triphosphatase YgiF
MKRSRFGKRGFMTPPVEIEVKLVTTPAMLTRLKTLPRLVGRDKRVRLITTYFDTPDRRLEKVCLTLRTRSKRGNHEQTVKMTSSADTVLHRGEWTTPLVGEQPRIDKFPENIRSRLRLALGEVEPAALSVARIDRITRQLPINTSVIELAFDTGTLEAGERSETICEVELELIEGQLQDLLKLALDLPLGSELQWSLVSKAQRCSALSLSKAMAATSAQAPMLSQAMDIATGFKAISWNCLDHLLLNYPLVIATGDAEALHQCRVAIRRLRVAWGLFAKLVGEDEQAVLEAGMKAVACRLGKARDLYVLHHRLALSDDQDHRSRAALSWLQKMLVGKTDQVRQVLSSASFQHLLFDTACWIEGGAWCKNAMKSKEQALARFAARRLSRHHQWLTQQKRRSRPGAITRFIACVSA